MEAAVQGVRGRLSSVLLWTIQSCQEPKTKGAVGVVLGIWRWRQFRCGGNSLRFESAQRIAGLAAKALA